MTLNFNPVGALAFSACLVLGMSQALAIDLYECGDEELSILVTLDRSNPNTASIQYDGGEMINASILSSGDKLYYELAAIPAASGAAYAGFGKQFHAKGNEGFLRDKGEKSDCKLVTASSQPQAHETGAVGDSEVTINATGRSLGGRLRDGPGTNFKTVGSLAEGTWLTLVTNTGVVMDGYPWFEISTDDGRRAYQWGGILCSNGQLLNGVYEQCR
nr:SH3 domain-containing protein [uncultured Cohaesibacter sp.]